LFSWIIGLLTELQRSEVISFQKLLYYPISLTGTFLVNYLSSFASFTLIIFLPAMIGLCIASVVALGPYLLVTLPMLFGLVLMVTAVTYQFRGWLASLMMNKRRRRTLVMAIGAAFILIVQLPNLFNRLYLRPGTNQDGASAQQMLERTQKLSEELKRHEISPEQAQARLDALQHAPLGDRQLGDLLAEPRGVGQGVERGLERKGDGRCGGPAQVVRRNRAHGLELRLGQQRAHAPRVLALPRLELDEVRARQDELYPRAVRPREHQPPGEQRLEPGRHRRHHQRTARFCHAVNQLDARRVHARRVAQLGERDERAGDLRGHVDPLGRVDPDGQPLDEPVQLTLRQSAQNVREPVVRFRGSRRGHGPL